MEIIHRKINKFTQKGFTLMEMLFVIVIMSVIAVSIVQFTNQFGQNKLIKKTAADMQSILSQAQYFYVLNNHWPTTADYNQGSLVYNNYRSPWPGGTSKDSCNAGYPQGTQAAPAQCYYGQQAAGKNYYEVSVTVPTEFIAHKIKALLPQGSVDGTTVTAYGSTYSSASTNSQDKRIAAMDTSYCNGEGITPDKSYQCVKTYGNGDYPHVATAPITGLCSSGTSAPVIFPVLGSWDRGSTNKTANGNKSCISDLEAGIAAFPNRNNSYFIIEGYHATGISNASLERSADCLRPNTATNRLSFDSYKYGGSTNFYFIACIPKTTLSTINQFTAVYPKPYLQWSGYYNQGCSKDWYADSSWYPDSLLNLGLNYCSPYTSNGTLSPVIYGHEKIPLPMMIMN